MENLRFIPADHAELLYTVSTMAEIYWAESFKDCLPLPTIQKWVEKEQSVDAINEQIVKEGANYYVVLSEYLLSGYFAYTITGDQLVLNHLFLDVDMPSKALITAIITYLKKVAQIESVTCIHASCPDNDKVLVKAYQKNGFIETEPTIEEVLDTHRLRKRNFILSL